MEFSAVNSHEDNRNYLLQLLEPEILFYEVATREETLVYMILMDFLREAGFKLEFRHRNLFLYRFRSFLHKRRPVTTGRR